MFVFRVLINSLILFILRSAPGVFLLQIESVSPLCHFFFCNPGDVSRCLQGFYSGVLPSVFTRFLLLGFAVGVYKVFTLGFAVGVYKVFTLGFCRRCLQGFYSGVLPSVFTRFLLWGFAVGVYKVLLWDFAVACQ